MLSQVFNFLLYSLVVKHNVWLPYPVGWHSDKLNASKIFWIPFEFVVIPDLEKKTEHVSLACWHTCVSSKHKLQLRLGGVNVTIGEIKN